MSKRDDRLKRLARRAEYLEKRIADGVVSGKDLTWDKGEASALRFVLQHVEALEADLAAALEDVARIQLERDRALGELQEMGRQWRPVDLGPKGEWFMGRLKDGAEKPLRRLPDGHSYEYSDVNETYYSWYWLTHWRPLTNDERAAIDASRAGEGR